MGGDRLDRGEDRLHGGDLAGLGEAKRSATRVCGPTSDNRERIKALEREVRELRQANVIPCRGLGAFCPGETRPPVQAMIAFTDDHHTAYGVEPICRVLPITLSITPRRPPGRSCMEL
jgi:hypothetical protein